MARIFKSSINALKHRPSYTALVDVISACGFLNSNSVEHTSRCSSAVGLFESTSASCYVKKMIPYYVVPIPDTRDV